MNTDDKKLHKRKIKLSDEDKFTMYFIFGVTIGSMIILVSILVMFAVLEAHIY